VSHPLDINSAGQITGIYGDLPQAFITAPNGVGITGLGTLGGRISAGFGINDAGQVVGYSGTASGQIHAFITGADGVGMTDLGTLGGNYSEAYGINDAGQVVGFSNTDHGQTHAFITGPNGEGMTDLNSLIDLPDWVLTSAGGINNAGQVIAIAQLIPEPETYAMLLAGLCLIGFMARRKRLLV
jgi:probable HAF family extracellular repeat protein